MKGWILTALGGLSVFCLTGCQALAAVAPVVIACAAAELTDGFQAGGPSTSQPEGATSPSLSDIAVRRMIRLYDACEYARCLQEAEAILRRPDASAAALATAHLYKGAILCLRGQASQATSSFRQAHRLAPRRRLDPQRFKPAVVACCRNAVFERRP